MSGRYGGPPDGGLTTAMTALAHRLAAAREVHAQAVRDAHVSLSVRVMVAGLNAGLGGDYVGGPGH